MSARGQIIDKGRNRWMVRAPLGREPGTGKRLYHSKTIHGTKRDAQQYLTRVLRELDDGTHVEQSRITVGECGLPITEFLIDGNLERTEFRERVPFGDLFEQLGGRTRSGFKFFPINPRVFPKNGEILYFDFFH